MNPSREEWAGEIVTSVHGGEGKLIKSHPRAWGKAFVMTPSFGEGSGAQKEDEKSSRKSGNLQNPQACVPRGL